MSKLRRRSLALVAGLVAALAAAAPASADGPAPRALLGSLAAHQTHGWASISGGIDYGRLEATIASGGRVYVPCGVASMLAKRLLDRYGIPNRLIGAFSDTDADLYDVPAGTLESHAMIEVWEGGRWVLYDVDGDVEAVDDHGNGVGIVDFARGPRRYRRLTDPATDPDHDLTDSPNPDYEAWLFAHHEEWYDRVLATLAIMPPGAHVYYFTDPTRKAVLDPMAGYEWVPEQEWERIVAAPPPAPPQTAPVPVKPPAPAPVAPAPAPAPPAAVVKPSGTRPACTLRGRQVTLRRVSCATARRVLSRYAAGGRAPHGWRCRGRRTVSCQTRGGRLAAARGLA